MKAIIFHGTECKPEDFWYQWLKEKLEARGYTVELPYYSDMNRVPIAEYLPRILKAHSFDEETVLIGHSAGCPLILSILENIDATIAQAVLVAGFSEELPPETGDDVILQPSYDWEKTKAHCQDFVFINSDNDPWGCDDKQGRKLFDKLGGTQIIRHDGHFGSTSNNQPYKEFPLLERVIGAEK
jgi:predicted alpha/beta hydrolase family esterase